MSLLNITIAVAIIVFLLWQLYPLLRARQLQGTEAPQLDDVVSEDQIDLKQLLFYFWSPACVMCRNVTPVIDKLMESRNDVVKLNVVDQMDIAKRFKIMGTPTLVLIQQGKITKILVGAQSEARILSLLEQ